MYSAATFRKIRINDSIFREYHPGVDILISEGNCFAFYRSNMIYKIFKDIMSPVHESGKYVFLENTFFLMSDELSNYS